MNKIKANALKHGKMNFEDFWKRID